MRQSLLAQTSPDYTAAPKAGQSRWARGSGDLPNLRALITESPPKGWGEDPDKVESLIEGHGIVETLYEEEMKLDRGGDHTTEEGKAKAKRAKDNNVMDCSTQGNSRSYTLTRLSKDRPDLFEKVVEGDLSANAAAIEAGLSRLSSIYKQV